MPLRSPWPVPAPSRWLPPQLQAAMTALSMLPVPGGMAKIDEFDPAELANFAADMGASAPGLPLGQTTETSVGKLAGAPRAAKAVRPALSAPLEGEAPPTSAEMERLLASPPTVKGESEALQSLLRNLSKLKGMRRSAPAQEAAKLLAELGPRTEPRELREIAIRRQILQSSFDNLMRALNQGLPAKSPVPLYDPGFADLLKSLKKAK